MFLNYKIDRVFFYSVTRAISLGVSLFCIIDVKTSGFDYYLFSAYLLVLGVSSSAICLLFEQQVLQDQRSLVQLSIIDVAIVISVLFVLQVLLSWILGVPWSFDRHAHLVLIAFISALFSAQLRYFQLKELMLFEFLPLVARMLIVLYIYYSFKEMTDQQIGILFVIVMLLVLLRTQFSVQIDSWKPKLKFLFGINIVNHFVFDIVDRSIVKLVDESSFYVFINDLTKQIVGGAIGVLVPSFSQQLFSAGTRLLRNIIGLLCWFIMVSAVAIFFHVRHSSQSLDSQFEYFFAAIIIVLCSILKSAFMDSFLSIHGYSKSNTILNIFLICLGLFGWLYLSSVFYFAVIIGIFLPLLCMVMIGRLGTYV